MDGSKKEKSDNPINEFASIFTSDSKFLKASDDEVDYDKIDIAPVEALFNDKKRKSKNK